MAFVYGNDYTVHDQDGNPLGSIDGDEFIRVQGKPVSRIDDEEIYSLDIPCKLLGYMEGLKGVNLDGSIRFTLKSDQAS
ncbi:hypothetical protein ACI2JR_14580 [Klebsiella sp. NPDC088457]